MRSFWAPHYCSTPHSTPVDLTFLGDWSIVGKPLGRWSEHWTMSRIVGMTTPLMPLFHVLPCVTQAGSLETTVPYNSLAIKVPVQVPPV